MAIGIGRRHFIFGLGDVAAWPLAVRAQQPSGIKRVGFLGASFDDPTIAAEYQAFLGKLREFGFSDGQNIKVDYRRIDDPRGTTVAGAELMKLQPDLIVVAGSENALQSVIGASHSIPIVI